MKKEVIEHGLIYWWGEGQTKTNEIILEQINKALGCCHVWKIEINGSDFNDGRESRTLIIRPEDGRVSIEKNF